MSRTKAAGLLVTALTASGVAWFLWHAAPEMQEATPQQQTAPGESAGETPGDESAGVKPTEALPALPDTVEQVTNAADFPYSDSEIRQIDAWYRQHGYFLDDGRANYEAYDQNLLQELARNNDLLAIQLLAERAQRAGDLETASAHYMHAAALGSIRDLDMLSALHFANYRRARENDDHNAQRQHKIQLFAVNEVMYRRGYITARRDSQLYQTRLNMALAQEETALVEETAEEIYRALLEQRRELGLGDFENRLPPLLEEHFRRSLQGPAGQ